MRCLLATRPAVVHFVGSLFAGRGQFEKLPLGGRVGRISCELSIVIRLLAVIVGVVHMDRLSSIGAVQ